MSALVASVSGASDRVTWLTATARTPEAVAHWRQGPYLLTDETVEIAVELPEAIRASVLRHGHGYVSARVVATTVDGRPFPPERLGRAPLTVDQGLVVGLPRARWSEAVPEAFASVDDGGAQ